MHFRQKKKPKNKKPYLTSASNQQLTYLPGFFSIKLLFLIERLMRKTPEHILKKKKNLRGLGTFVEVRAHLVGIYSLRPRDRTHQA